MKGLALNKTINKAGNDYVVRLTHKGKLIEEYTMSSLINQQMMYETSIATIIHKAVLSYGLDFTFEQIDLFLQGKA